MYAGLYTWPKCSAVSITPVCTHVLHCACVGTCTYVSAVRSGGVARKKIRIKKT